MRLAPSIRLTSALLLAASLSAQTAHVGSWTGPCSTTVEDMNLNPPACGPTASQIPSYPAGGICFGPTPFPLGGHGLDQLHNLVYASDGFFVYASANPLYTPTSCGGVIVKVRVVPGETFGNHTTPSRCVMSTLKSPFAAASS